MFFLLFWFGVKVAPTPVGCCLSNHLFLENITVWLIMNVLVSFIGLLCVSAGHLVSARLESLFNDRHDFCLMISPNNLNTHLMSEEFMHISEQKESAHWKPFHCEGSQTLENVPRKVESSSLQILQTQPDTILGNLLDLTLLHQRSWPRRSLDLLSSTILWNITWGIVVFSDLKSVMGCGIL